MKGKSQAQNNLHQPHFITLRMPGIPPWSVSGVNDSMNFQIIAVAWIQGTNHPGSTVWPQKSGGFCILVSYNPWSISYDE